jgi:hypothetical protein
MESIQPKIKEEGGSAGTANSLLAGEERRKILHFRYAPRAVLTGYLS